jgi:hypothetical protein
MELREHPLTDEAREEIAEMTVEGYALVGVDPRTADADDVTAAVSAFLDHLRDAGEEPHDGDMAALACVWADQVARRAGWEWVLVSDGEEEDGDGPVAALASADRTHAVMPFELMYDLYDAPPGDEGARTRFEAIRDGALPAAKAGSLHLVD